MPKRSLVVRRSGCRASMNIASANPTNMPANGEAHAHEDRWHTLRAAHVRTEPRPAAELDGTVWMVRPQEGGGAACAGTAIILFVMNSLIVHGGDQEGGRHTNPNDKYARIPHADQACEQPARHDLRVDIQYDVCGFP